MNEQRRAQAEKCIQELIKGWDLEQQQMSLGAIHEAEVDSNSNEEAESSSSGGGGVVHWNPYWEDEEEDDEEDGQQCECGVGTSRQCEVIVEQGKCEGCRSIVGCTGDCENFFSGTCDARALPLVGGGSESVWKGGSRGGVVWG